jgi:putative sterol carrier protein
MPLVWDEDVADAFMLALKSGARGAFNLAAGEPLPARELAKAGGMRLLRVPRGALRGVEKLVTALKLLPPSDPGWLGGVDFPLVYSSERARRELGWKPRCPTSREVMRHYAETVPGKVDRRISVWARVVDGVARREQPRGDLAGFDATVHLDLTGPGGGDFTLRASGGRVRLRPGAPRPADAAVSMKASLLLDLLAGRTDFAGAQLSGRVRVEGQGLAGLLVSGLIATFRAAGKQPGWRGLSVRSLTRWISG